MTIDQILAAAVFALVSVTGVPPAEAGFENPIFDGMRPGEKAEPAPLPPAPAPKPAPAVAPKSAPAGGILACIRRYESRGNYRVVSPSGKYRGAYQFDLPTWRSVGGTGDPARASVAEQDKRAAILLARRGLQPWPTPRRHC